MHWCAEGGVEACAPCANRPGIPSGHYHGHLDHVLPAGKPDGAYFYKLTVPTCMKNDIGRAERPFTILVPHLQIDEDMKSCEQSREPTASISRTTNCCCAQHRCNACPPRVALHRRRAVFAHGRCHWLRVCQLLDRTPLSLRCHSQEYSVYLWVPRMVLDDPDILLHPLVTWHDGSWSFPLGTTAHLGNRATHLVLPRRGLRCSSESQSCICRAIGVSAMQVWVYPRWQIPFVRAFCESSRLTTLQRLLAVDRSISHSVRPNQATAIAACERCEVRVTLEATIAHAGRSSVSLSSRVEMGVWSWH